MKAIGVSPHADLNSMKNSRETETVLSGDALLLETGETDGR
jgi:hypothetical protein